MKIKLPDYIKSCIDRLDEKGFNAYIVGGCVRDSILGRVPNDWDVCTSALPHEIKDAFKDYKTIDVGIEHGTVAVVVEKNIVEITTFRIDGEYTDNRRPDYVEFTSSLREDLRRRDFTINAMAYSDNMGVIDYFNGKDDLRKSLIRCVGDASTRFNEDALRIMRGIRFAAQLGYSIEESTYEAMRECSGLIRNISAERIREEISKLVLGDYADIGCGFILDLDMIPIIFSELAVSAKCYDKNKISDSIRIINKLPKDLPVRLCVILKAILELYSIGNEYSGGLDILLLKRLRYDNALISKTHLLFENYGMTLSDDRVEMKTALNRMGAEAYRKLLDIREVIDDEDCDFNNIRLNLKEILDSGEPYELKHLKINGGDILELGVPKGKEVGSILNRLMKMVIIHPEYNSRDELIKQCLKMIN